VVCNPDRTGWRDDTAQCWPPEEKIINKMRKKLKIKIKSPRTSALIGKTYFEPNS
jgi:hypothetical protein